MAPTHFDDMITCCLCFLAIPRTLIFNVLYLVTVIFDEIKISYYLPLELSKSMKRAKQQGGS